MASQGELLHECLDVVINTTSIKHSLTCSFLSFFLFFFILVSLVFFLLFLPSVSFTTRRRQHFILWGCITTGATLQNYNNQLVKCIEDLREKREEVNRQILKEEEEKAKIQKDLAILTERLSKINESLQRKQQARSEYDQTIQETEAAYMKILESSQTLLHVLKRESVNLVRPAIFFLYVYICLWSCVGAAGVGGAVRRRLDDETECLFV